MEEISSVKMFGGLQKRFKHTSDVCQCEMIFAVFLPPQAQEKKCPVLYWLSGLTCTDENFVTKAAAQQYAAKYGIIIIAPDTSPRGDGIPDDPEQSWDFGLGAGFYVNATQEPWVKNYQMYDYITKELPEIINSHFPVNGKQSISGHSMGGHGALIIGLSNPTQYQSISAFSPIVNPTQVPWGIKAFSNYLGADKLSWEQYDACSLVENSESGSPQPPIRVEQGEADNFLNEQLQPEEFEMACQRANYPLALYMREGYDHSYYFIASFMQEHFEFHAKALGV